MTNACQRVIFLDYDGVVNTPMWELRNGQWKCRFNHDFDGKVNNTQAVQWVSEFCEKYGYDIVVTSTWRYSDDYDVFLIQAGLRKGIEILGRTPFLRLRDYSKTRGDEISQYLAENPEITGYLIFDDEADMGPHLDHLVQCNPDIGFGYAEYCHAEELHRKFNATDQPIAANNHHLFL